MTKNVISVNNYGWQDEKPIASLFKRIYPFIIKKLKELGGEKILDLGCGNGFLCQIISTHGFNVTGCDVDENGIEIAKKAHKDITFKLLSVYDDPALLMDGNFDVVISTEVIEHLLLPRHLPRFAKAVLKKNGYLIISTPYYGYWVNLILAILNKWDGHHAPLVDGWHIKFWSRKTLTKLLEEEGFEVKEFHGLGRLPYLWQNMVLIGQKR
jgi:2-polyprenyl-3-methyl-5-hydroxy-6-metoxy-1,4-benzoquinol methylase